MIILLKPTVIVIDDEPDVREVLSEYLSLKSINVLATGNNGKDAVELYKKFAPDVVLMDFMMPEYDRLFGLQNIRKMNSNAKVIMVTGNANSDIHTKLTESGSSLIIQKPCDMDNLVETIGKISSDNSIQDPSFVVT